MCSKMRRFVHLLADDLRAPFDTPNPLIPLQSRVSKEALKRCYTLRSVDTGPLFADANAGTSGSRSRFADLPQPRFADLPHPRACFEPPRAAAHMEFFLLGSKIVGINEHRRTTLWDTVTSAVRVGPDLRHCKAVNPAWAALGGRLFLINTFPHSHGTPCFEALRFDDSVQDWSWDLLPSPPFLDMPFERHCDIQSYGAGDEKNMSISTEGKGTYTFNVTTGAWRKAGGWALPFVGRVQYVPDYDLCLGFCSKTLDLCSAHLVAGDSEPPVLRKVMLEDDVDEYIEAGWSLARSHLTYLGCGKFCVTRFYDTTQSVYEFPMSYHVAVMTGVEARFAAYGTDELQMVSRASRRFKFSLGTRFGWAL